MYVFMYVRICNMDDSRRPPEVGGGPPRLIDLGSARTAWTKDPDAKVVATSPRTDLRLVLELSA